MNSGLLICYTHIILLSHTLTPTHPHLELTDSVTFKVLHFKQHLIFLLTARAGILSDLKDPHIKGLVSSLWC